MNIATTVGTADATGSARSARRARRRHAVNDFVVGRAHTSGSAL